MKEKSALKKILGSREFLLFVIVVAMFLIVSAINPAFFSFKAIQDMMKNNAVTMVMALGMLCVMLVGGIDISCMSALASAVDGSTAHPINHSKGCGGVMRVAPIGLYFAEKRIPMRASDVIGAEAAAITHGHELGWLPAAALVHIIRHLVEHDGNIFLAVQDAITTLPQVFPAAAKMDELLSLLQKAVDLSRQELDDLDAVRQLGRGWVGEEALAIAVYCALRHPDSFEDAIIAAVNHSGDSDSTGAIAGNIMGAALGFQAIPEK